MTKVTRLEAVTSWKRALNAARRTMGKPAVDKEPSDAWKAKMLLAEHSPIRLVEYEWTWTDIPQFVTVHFVRHHIGCEKFVHSQRPDRTGSDKPRSELTQTEPNDMDMTANAQEIMAISRLRLCNCASKETRDAWKLMLEHLRTIDPILVSKCVPSCVYRGFCPEMKSCGYVQTDKFQQALKDYRKTDY